MSNEYQKEQDTKMFDTPAVMDDSNSMFRTIMEKDALVAYRIAWMILPIWAKGQVVINEIQVANVDMYIDPSFNYGSWVELYNPSDTEISLEGMKLRHTDAEEVIREERLTARHGLLGPKGFCLLWFDHYSEDGSYGGKADQQIPFKMDVEGGIVELLNSKGSLMDAVSYPPATTRCSYARTVDGGTTWGLTSQPTPKHTDTGSTFAEERLTAPQTDRKGSVFSAPFTLKVNIPTGTTLHYTTDGATPVPGKSMVSETGTFSITETSIPAELSRQIIKEVSGFEGVHGVYDLILHNYGPDVKIGSLHINVYDTMSAHEIHGPSTSSGCISGQHR